LTPRRESVVESELAYLPYQQLGIYVSFGKLPENMREILAIFNFIPFGRGFDIPHSRFSHIAFAKHPNWAPLFGLHID
jgi:hypothetical protein